ncbi:PQQ-binding-like beta-propeller repeat protein [Halomicrobium sp. IBSBa]|uniref:outer membrane protein assembly factor BamB family protein n=1 Tax=Halomicrobium sp. IBSBa TaxID=2778916 RepID=UPI001ABF0ED5|nr:PQQ-binding-like beta-propeller repeat protein [Halomicrobium sp. IBSBa]MBO4247595.1 PQQ-binding-like beta-propeller repeat protein [Halomicrobium sp. IBSBa]
MSSNETFVSRRKLLTVLGGSVVSLSGCQTVEEEIDRRFGPTEYISDAPIEGDSGPWSSTRGGPDRRSYIDRNAGPDESGDIKRISPTSREPSPLQPVICNGQVLVQLLDIPAQLIDNTIEAFSGTLSTTTGGIQLWHQTGTGPSMSVIGDTAVVPHDSGITAVDATDGSVCWRFEHGGYLTAAGTTVCVENHDRLFGLDARTGSVQWKKENFSDQGSFKYTINAFAAVDGLLCGTRKIHYDAPSLVAFDPKTGSVEWYGKVSPTPWPPVIGPNRVYVLTAEDVLSAFSWDGELEWSTEVNLAAPPAVGDSGLYTITTDRTSIVGLNPSTGDEKWKVEVDSGIPLPPAVTPQSLFTITGDEESPVTVIALNPDSGDKQWEHSYPGTEGFLAGSLDMPPALTENGLVFTTGDSGVRDNTRGTYLLA